MEGEAQEAPLAPAADPAGDVQEGLGHDRAAAHDADPAALLDHEEPRRVARGAPGGRAARQAADHELRGEAGVPRPESRRRKCPKTATGWARGGVRRPAAAREARQERRRGDGGPEVHLRPGPRPWPGSRAGRPRGARSCGRRRASSSRRRSGPRPGGSSRPRRGPAAGQSAMNRPDHVEDDVGGQHQRRQGEVEGEVVDREEGDQDLGQGDGEARHREERHLGEERQRAQDDDRDPERSGRPCCPRSGGTRRSRRSGSAGQRS